MGRTFIVHYSGRIGSQVFDSSYGKEPFLFDEGAEQVIPGFEKAVLSLSKGQKKSFTIPSLEAYGPRNEMLITEIPLDKLGDLPNQVNLKEGSSFILKDQLNEEVIATVAKMTEGSIVLDLNHPLAGKDLIFDLELVDIL